MLQLAVQRGITRLKIKSDAMAALQHITTGIPLYNNLICDCRYLLSKLKVWVIRYVFRKQNRTVDRIAKEEASLGHFGDIKHFLNVLEFMQNLLVMDSVGTTYPSKLAINDFYAGWDVSFEQFGNVLCYFKDLLMLPLGSQHWQPQEG